MNGLQPQSNFHGKLDFRFPVNFVFFKVVLQVATLGELDDKNGVKIFERHADKLQNVWMPFKLAHDANLLLNVRECLILLLLTCLFCQDLTGLLEGHREFLTIDLAGTFINHHRTAMTNYLSLHAVIPRYDLNSQSSRVFEELDVSHPSVGHW